MVWGITARVVGRCVVVGDLREGGIVVGNSRRLFFFPCFLGFPAWSEIFGFFLCFMGFLDLERERTDDG